MTLGREPGSKRDSLNGVYLYDPYPRAAQSQYMKITDPGFWTLFESADNRFKYTQIVTMITV